MSVGQAAPRIILDALPVGERVGIAAVDHQGRHDDALALVAHGHHLAIR